MTAAACKNLYRFVLYHRIYDLSIFIFDKIKFPDSNRMGNFVFYDFFLFILFMTCSTCSRVSSVFTITISFENPFLNRFSAIFSALYSSLASKASSKFHSLYKIFTISPPCFCKNCFHRRKAPGNCAGSLQFPTISPVPRPFP